MNLSTPGAAPPVTLEPQPPPPRAVFRADAVSPPNTAASAGAAIEHAAELVAHAGAQTPLVIGLFGAPGAGKSLAAAQLASRAAALAGARAGGPFISSLVVTRLSAPNCTGDPAEALAAGLHNGLAAQGYGALARAAAQAATDPHVAARDANARLDDTRARLDTERRALEELDGRRARLGETLLYESAGSRVDAYARANRAKIESRLRAFGFTGEPIASYKDLVRDVAEHPGLTGRASAFARALWAFGGQARLIVWAILLFLLAWGAGVLGETSGVWLPWLRGLTDQIEPVAAWLGAHLSLFGLLRQGAIAAACLCLALNLWRAMRFTGPLTRGARLLRADIDTRRRELDAQAAHQTRRVDALAGESDIHARDAAEAEQRAGGSPQAGAAKAPEPAFASFTDAIEAAIARGGDAPQRILVSLDDLDMVSPAQAAGLLEAMQRLTAKPGFALLVCASPAHLAAGWGGPADAAACLQKLVQIPLSITLPGGEDGLRAYAAGLLGAGAARVASPIDASRSALDKPFQPGEAELVAALAPLSGRTPRAVKRFVNIYRLARARSGDPAGLALMLALDAGGTAGERAAMAAALQTDDPEGALRIEAAEPRLAGIVAVTDKFRGAPLTRDAARAASDIAADYSAPR